MACERHLPDPYRCLYSKNISNLFLAGRGISASHVAFGSTRVMATAAYVSQAVGMAAAMCREGNILPADIITKKYIGVLQQRLLKTGQYIPGFVLSDETDKVQTASITASSELVLQELPEQDFLKPLDLSVAQMIPLKAGKIAPFIVHAQSEAATSLQVELRISSKASNHTPDITLATQTLSIHPGRNCLQLEFDAVMNRAGYAFLTFMKNPQVQLHYTHARVTGVLSAVQYREQSGIELWKTNAAGTYRHGYFRVLVPATQAGRA